MRVVKLIWDLIVAVSPAILGIVAFIYGIQGEYARGAFLLGWVIVFLVIGERKTIELVISPNPNGEVEAYINTGPRDTRPPDDPGETFNETGLS